ncbi:MAG TPA: MFS transporter [Kofleriaceae bacterium]|nr:MFS transporter [Kofleriaceae bacterium]
MAATFAAHALMLGTLGPWMPQLKGRSGLDAGQLGAALAGMAVGMVLGTRLAGPAVRRVGGRAAVRVGVPVLAAGLALLPLARGLATLAAIFSLLGVAGGLLDVAMNGEAAEVERRHERRLMSTMHGTWSVSVLAGAGLASISISIGVPIAAHLPLLAALLVAASAVPLRWLPSPGAGQPGETAPAPAERGAAVGRAALLCVICGACFLTEGAATEWGAVYMRESVRSGAGIAGAAVVTFAGGMAASRFAGDRLAGRFEAATIARVGAGAGALALAVGLALGGVAASLAGFALLGVGIGQVVPLAFRAAGGIALGPARTALGIAVTCGYVGTIVGPLLVGLVADRVGLRAAFVIPVLTCSTAAIAAGALREPRAAPVTTRPTVEAAPPPR